MAIMRRIVVTVLGFALLTTTASAAEVAQVQLAYDTYAGGIEVMQMRVFFGLGPWNYRVDLDYHTTGLVGLLYRGHQTNTVRGMWQDGQAVPQEFAGEGIWRGHERRTLIGYDHGLPKIRELQPPQETERERVPSELQLHTMDTLSAVARLFTGSNRITPARPRSTPTTAAACWRIVAANTAAVVGVDPRSRRRVGVRPAHKLSRGTGACPMV